MNTHVINNPFWTTASFGDNVDTSPMELSALGDHLDRCHNSRGRWFVLRIAADALDRFMAARFVTTMVLVALLIGVASLAD